MYGFEASEKNDLITNSETFRHMDLNDQLGGLRVIEAQAKDAIETEM